MKQKTKKRATGMNSVSMNCSAFEVVMEMVVHTTLHHLHQTGIQIQTGVEFEN